MTKSILLMGVAIAVSGCASFSSKWSKVEEGQTRDEVEAVMGTPAAFSSDQMSWAADSFELCSVYFTDGKVYSKGCQDNSAARAAYNQAGMQMYQNYMQQQQARPTFTPAQVYQMPVHRQTQTNCTSNMMGGSAYTNCSSY